MLDMDEDVMVREDVQEKVDMPVPEALRLAVAKRDSAAFNAIYLRFLQQFPEFGNALADPAAPLHDNLVPYNPVFDVSAGFALAGSNTGEIATPRVKKHATALLTKGKAAQDVFAHMPLKDRLEFLALLEKRIARHQDGITLTITADTGKPIANTEAEMKKGGQWFTDAQEKAWGQLGETREGKKTKSIEPLGVVQIISAYNYPYALAIGGIVGALAAGNSIIITPANKAPNWIFPFMQAASEAIAEFADSRKKITGEQKNILGSLIQYSIGVNKPLTDDVDLVHFVGSNAVGEAISTSRAKKHKKSILELGGNSVVVVMKSALGVKSNGGAEGIAQKIFDGFAPATGQRCTAPRLIFLEPGTNAVAGALAALCRNEALEHKLTGSPCNPFERDAKMGPLMDTHARKRMEQALALAEELGAAVNGGKAEETRVNISGNIAPGGSCWVNPIVIDWSHVDRSKISDDQQAGLEDLLNNETFGPLVHVVKTIHNLQEAIDETNRRDNYKLAAAVFTGTPEDTETFQHDTGITSVTENSGPKDQSPQGPHGHPWLDSIGGESHYLLYTRQFVIKNLGQ